MIFKIHVQDFSLTPSVVDSPTDEEKFDTRNKVDNMFKVLTNGVEYLGSSGFTTSYKVDNHDMTINSVVQAISQVNMNIPNNQSVLVEFYPDSVDW